MRVHFMRHGEASFDAKTDFERRLTEKGRRDAAANSQHLHVDRVVASPLVRAQQTANIVADARQLTVQTDECWDLSSSVNKLMDWLDDHASNNLLVVSHNPLLSMLVSQLIGQHFELSPADVVSLEADIWQANCASHLA